MRAVLLKDFKTSSLVVDEIPPPGLKPGQILIKMAAASINPSDLIFLRNQYRVQKALPVVPGFEGSGTVVGSKAGLYGRWLLGKRVACRAPEDGNGTWAEFMATDATGVIPLKKTVTLDQGASLLVNPLTAWALLSMAKRDGHHAFVQTAASGALGQMMIRLARRRNMTCINIVRRKEQVELLEKEGAVYVLNSSEIGWEEQLQVLCQKLPSPQPSPLSEGRGSKGEGCRLVFDAVGGELTARVAAAMPKGSKLIVYGALAGENCEVNPRSLIFEGKTVEGFWLSDWIKRIGLFKKLSMASGVQRLLAGDLSTHVQARFPLKKVQQAIALYKEKRSDGKVLLLPNVS